MSLISFLRLSLSFSALIIHETNVGTRENRPLRQEPRGTRSERYHTPMGTSQQPSSPIFSFRCEEGHTDGAQITQSLPPKVYSFLAHLGVGPGSWAGACAHVCTHARPGAGSACRHLTSGRGLCMEYLVEEEEEEGGKNPLISEEMSQIRFVNQKPIYNMQELICFIFLSYIFVKHI